MLDKLYADRLPPVAMTTANRPDSVRGMPTGEIIRQVRASGPASREPVGSVLRRKIEKITSIRAGTGCKCKSLADQMDIWGVAGCESRRDEIIDHLVANRDVLVEGLKAEGGWLNIAAAGVAAIAPEASLRKGAGWLLDEAIEYVKQTAPPKPEKKQRVSPRPKGPVYSSWRSEADGPVFPMGPFESKIRHLSYFVYPANEQSWKWNLDELSKRFWLFNGKRVLGIVHDRDSATPDAVLEYAASVGMTFDNVLIKPNSPKQREVVLWVPMLECFSPETAGADEVVFSAHAKGQKYDDPTHTRDWTDLMYQTCLDDWPSVYNALRTALFAGSFREYGLFHKWYDWAYSGTVFWWRLAEIGKRKWRDVDPWFCGTESWPGKMCDPRETACLFLNDSKRMYDAHYWQSTVWPEWEKYKERLRAR